MENIQKNVHDLIEKIDRKKQRLGIDYPVEILAVTKTRTVEEMRAVIQSGVFQIGENRVQEAEKKFPELKDVTVVKHLIGHLQSNKINKALELFDSIQSVDRRSLCDKLNRHLIEKKQKIRVMIEVNTSGDLSKYGIKPDETLDLASAIAEEYPQLELAGLMTIGPLYGGEEGARKSFGQLFRIRENLLRQLPSVSFLHLSMGMSGDFLTAVEEGATMIRLGTVLFGSRNL